MFRWASIQALKRAQAGFRLTTLNYIVRSEPFRPAVGTRMPRFRPRRCPKTAFAVGRNYVCYTLCQSGVVVCSLLGSASFHVRLPDPAQLGTYRIGLSGFCGAVAHTTATAATTPPSSSTSFSAAMWIRRYPALSRLRCGLVLLALTHHRTCDTLTQRRNLHRIR